MKAQEKLQFQEQILEQMTKQHKTHFRGPIAAEFTLSASSANPPQIHTAIKNLLDLFGPPLANLPTKRRGLVYADDSQISYLGVTYWPGLFGSSIEAQFAPLRDFLLDLKLCRHVMVERTLDNSTLRDLGEDTDYDDLGIDDARHDLRHLLKNRDKTVERFGEKLFRTLERSYRMQLQEDLLKIGRLSLHDVFTFFHGSGQIPEYDYSPHNQITLLKEVEKKVSAQLSESLSRLPIRIRLSKIPVRKGDTERFKQELIGSIRTFKAKAAVLTPLLYPIRLEVVFKQPKASEGFSKDLDNVMRSIVTVFTSEFKPPMSFFSNTDISELDDSPISDSIKEYIRAIPKSIQYSLSGFDIFKVNRKDSEDEGFLSIGITGGIRMAHSIWKRIDRIICERKKTLD